jgi:hypothetical protein
MDEIRVPKGQVRQCRGFIGRKGSVENRQLTFKHVSGPSIKDDVMGDDEHNVISLSESNDPEPKQRTGREFEWPIDSLAENPQALRFPSLLGQS